MAAYGPEKDLVITNGVVVTEKKPLVRLGIFSPSQRLSRPPMDCALYLIPMDTRDGMVMIVIIASWALAPHTSSYLIHVDCHSETC